MLRQKLLILVGVVLLLIIVPSTVLPQQIATVNIVAERARDLSQTNYIPRFAKEIDELGHGDMASKWRSATPGSPILQHVFHETRRQITPLNWVVPVIYGGETIGLIGIDPSSGEYLWRIDSLPEGFQLPDIQTAQRSIAHLAPTINLQNVSFVFVRIGEKNHWLILPSGVTLEDTNKVKRCNILDISAKRILTVDEVLKTYVQTPHGGMLERENPKSLKPPPMIPSGKYQKTPSGLGSKTNQLESVLATPPSTYTVMEPNKVPYYYQGNCDWCVDFSLSMMNRWWGGSLTGSEIASWNGQACADPTTLSAAESIISQYFGWQWHWHGVMKSLPNSGTSSDADDLKGCIASDLPVLVVQNHDGTGTTADHARLAIGYTTSSVYLQDPAGWLGWYFDAAVSNALFEKLWNVTWQGVWPFEQTHGGAVGYPGNFVLPTISTSPSGIPTSDVQGSTFQIQLTLNINSPT